jgi:hypothetical protein
LESLNSNLLKSYSSYSKATQKLLKLLKSYSKATQATQKILKLLKSYSKDTQATQKLLKLLKSYSKVLKNIWYLTFETFYSCAKMTDTSLWYSLSKLISYIVITKNLRSICKSYNKIVIGSFIPRYNVAKAMIGIIILMSIYYTNLWFLNRKPTFDENMNQVFAYPYKQLWLPIILTTVHRGVFCQFTFW